MAYFKYILVPDVVTYYDALNRSVQTQSVSLNGETISSKVAYNAKGQVSQASLPYFENTTPQYTTFAYNDFLGRKTQQVTPDGSGGSAGTTSNITYNDIELTTTIVSGKNSQTQTNITKTNAFGQVVSVTNNNSKTINYTYDLMGRLSDTWTNGVGDPDLGPDHSPRPSPTQYDYHNGMEYNFHGKRKKLVDMSLGTIASTYDAYDQLRSETNGRDTITKYEYDNLGRMLSRTVVSSNDPSATNFETTTYTYGNNNDDSHITTFGKLLSVSTTWSNTINGTGTVSDEYSYDNLGRVSSLTKSIAGDKTYTESYTYDTYGRLNTLTYPGSNLIIQQTYKNGQLYQVNKMNGNNVGAPIWEAETKDNFGNITKYISGNGLQTTKTYDNNTGMLTQIKTGTSSSQTSIQNLQYQYDDLYNITQRKDVLSNQQDLFTYDNLNRLTEIQTFPNASQTTYTSKKMNYDDFGNITKKTDVGDLTYGVANDPNAVPPVLSSPYQITKIENNPNTITTNQHIFYTSFDKVRQITTSNEDGTNINELDFIYGPDYGRRKTTYKLNGNVTSTKYFAFGNYEEELNNITGVSKDYYIYGGDGVAAIYRQRTGVSDQLYYIHKDNLGSFDKVTNSSGAVVDSYSFDAWGNRRSTSDWTAAETGITHLFNRGFTGHEHLDAFGLINMNGRCYDPLLGRILSPDPELQDPLNRQNYNRYSYCLNNPLKYTDPSGYNHTQDLSKFFDNKWGVWGETNWDNENNSSYLWGGGFNSFVYNFNTLDDFGGGGNNVGSSGMDNKIWQDLLSSLGLSSDYSNNHGPSAENNNSEDTPEVTSYNGGLPTDDVSIDVADDCNPSSGSNFEDGEGVVTGPPLIPGGYNNSWDNFLAWARNWDSHFDGSTWSKETRETFINVENLVSSCFPVTSITVDLFRITTGYDPFTNNKLTNEELAKAWENIPEAFLPQKYYRTLVFGQYLLSPTPAH